MIEIRWFDLVSSPDDLTLFWKRRQILFSKSSVAVEGNFNVKDNSILNGDGWVMEEETLRSICVEEASR